MHDFNPTVWEAFEALIAKWPSDPSARVTLAVYAACFAAPRAACARLTALGTRPFEMSDVASAPDAELEAPVAGSPAMT